MNLDKTPEQLAVDVAGRSTCAVQVGAVIADRKGRIFSWGWNNAGKDGRGQHAEENAIFRANRKRLRKFGCTIYVAGIRRRTGRGVCSKPCPRCDSLIKFAGSDIRIRYRDATGEWRNA